MDQFLQRKRWPILALTIILIVTVLLLRTQGRIWICACGQILLWAGDTMSSDNSQHISDPYTFTHILHGFIFFWLLVLILPRLSLTWRFVIAIFIEAAWEVVENTSFVIERYREVTASLGYTGDSIINSVADIFFCGIGFILVKYLGFWRSFILFIIIELILAFWIRDSLILNIIMLLYPLDAIKEWQLGLSSFSPYQILTTISNILAFA